MATTSGPTLVVRNPSEKSRHVPNAADERIGSLKTSMESTIQGTNWPSESKAAAQAFVKTIKLSPSGPKDLSAVSKELQDAYNEYIRVIEDVYTRIEDASSRPARWKDRLSSLFTDRPSRCTLVFQTCEADVSSAAKALNEYLENDRKKVPSPASTQLAPVSSPRPSGRSAPTTAPVSTQTPPANAPQPVADHWLTRQEMLTTARRTFKAVGIASSSIPVAGNFVGAAAQMGLAFVEALQTVDQNEESAKDIEAQTMRLQKLLKRFTDKTSADQEDGTADHIEELQGELRNAQAKMALWRSSGGFKKTFSARDDAEAFKGHQAGLQIMQEEMQFLVSLDIRDMITELKSVEIQKEKRRLLDRLGDGKYGAQGNMLEDVVCFPGTRVVILNHVNDWITDTSDESHVLWLHGMAGRGKSTIASTVLHNWKGRASCAIFHFRRGQTALNARAICALARQLGESLDPEVKGAVLDSVRQNEDIADKRLEEQFKTLLVTPLAQPSTHSHPILLIVDALDECNHSQDAVDLLNLIHRHSSSFPPNVKFLLTSRPEFPLVHALKRHACATIDLESASEVSNDLKLFLREKFVDVRDSRSIRADWPSPEEIDRVVTMSQGLFQWARTVITYLSEGSPTARLQMLLKDPGKWSGLDELYRQILQKAFHNVKLDPTRQQLLCSVLGLLVVAPTPVSLEVIAGLYGDQDPLAGGDLDDGVDFLRNDLLVDLVSLLFVPKASGDPIRLVHTSVRDLLVNETRCEGQMYHVNATHRHRDLASVCIGHMLRTLKHNMCDLAQHWLLSSEIQEVGEKTVSKAIRYCCLAWYTHLTEGNITLDISQLEDFELFSREKLMFWLEVISLIGATAQAIQMVKVLGQWLLHTGQPPECSALKALWNDFERFLSKFAIPVATGPLHIYTSALSYCPAETELWRCYGQYATIKILKGGSNTWDSTLWTRYADLGINTVCWSPDGKRIALGTSRRAVQLHDAESGNLIAQPLEGHNKAVNSVCFSPDGKLLASGSADQTIRLWNPQTGEAVGRPLEGHHQSIKSVCFSPDGKLLASGSHDQTIRLWNPQTGEAVGQPLEGHDDSVYSVCFSPDGKLLASGSRDKTVRLWNPQTGKPIGQPLKGHNDSVTCVSFSPDGKLLASGSDDQTIRLWNPQTGEAVGQPFEDHEDWVTSICFSPDGKRLASSSHDQTIRLWNPQAGEAVGQPLGGHEDWVTSVSFSPDGKLLASGSDDRTIRLWNPQTGEVVCQTLEDHEDWVTSVCFSPDGKCLASSSHDQTIRLWNPQTGEAVGQPLEGHDHWISSVSFSLDGKLLASGSHDKTIRLWNPQTGEAVGQPLEGHDGWVTCVCFSPDRKLLASGSDDQTIRLWNPQTGEAVGQPLGGHEDWVTSASFSPDGKLLVSGSADHTIRLWNPQTGEAVGQPFEGHDGSVTSVFFSPNGKLLASGSDNRTIRLWDPQTGQTIGDPCESPGGFVSFVAVSREGTHFILLHSNGHLVDWQTLARPLCLREIVSDAASARLSTKYLAPQIVPTPCHSYCLVWHPFLYQGASFFTHYCTIHESSALMAAFQGKKIAILDISRILPYNQSPVVGSL